MYEKVRLYEERLNMLKDHIFKECLANVLYKEIEVTTDSIKDYRFYSELLNLQFELLEILEETEQQYFK